MAYAARHGRRPYERASKIGHSEIVNNAEVQAFLKSCATPQPAPAGESEALIRDVPEATGRITTVVAIDGGMNETSVRDEYPSAAINFMTMGPLLLELEHLEELDALAFIGPDDMARLRDIQRYNFAYPVRVVRYGATGTFSEGVRRRVHEFLTHGDGHLMGALEWLLFRGWLPESERVAWSVPACPTRDCDGDGASFRWGGRREQPCARCGRTIYLADVLRLYERVDDELGAGAIASYLLTALEQVILVHLIKSVLQMKPDLMREILFIKDGPLAFFGTTAPLYAPMRELMSFLGSREGGPLINLVGVVKSGPLVEHAAAIGSRLRPFQAMVVPSSYMYRYVMPGDPANQVFGRNTYYGAPVIFKGASDDLYVGTVPLATYVREPEFEQLFNGPDVLRTTAKLRCSMYDNALVPVALANKLVSLADVPSSEILGRFARRSLA
jgi:hypothetical protein